MISSYRHDKSPFASSGAGEEDEVTPASRGDGVATLRYLDVVLVVVAAPILLLIGVSAVGYGVGAGAWLALRIVGVAVERYTRQTHDARREISVRLGYLMARIFLLALAVILVRKGSGRDAALTALLLIVFAFTVQLVISFIERPRSNR
jgi:hypothetical protein